MHMLAIRLVVETLTCGLMAQKYFKVRIEFVFHKENDGTICVIATMLFGLLLLRDARCCGFVLSDPGAGKTRPAPGQASLAPAGSSQPSRDID